MTSIVIKCIPPSYLLKRLNPHCFSVSPPVDPNPTPARPTLQIPGGNPRWNAHVTQLHMWHQQLEENQMAAFYQQHHITQAVLRRAAEQNEDEPLEQPPAQQAAAPQPPPAAQDPEEQHDLLDVFYLIIRALFLLALAWNYASPAKFCFMAVLLFYIYLYQSGYIDLPSLFPRYVKYIVLILFACTS